MLLQLKSVFFFNQKIFIFRLDHLAHDTTIVLYDIIYFKFETKDK